jgi:mRNA interferase HigB
MPWLTPPENWMVGSVDKVGERFVFNIGGNKYRLIASIAFTPQLFWIKAVLTHADYDKGEWK